MNIHVPSRPDLAIFIPSFGDGGVERMMVNLPRGLCNGGISVDFLISRNEGPFLSTLPSGVRVIECGTAHPAKVVPELCRYLTQEHPSVLMSVKRCGQEALQARQTARTDTRLVVRVGTTVSKRVEGRNLFKRFKSFYEMRKYCPRADDVIAVSNGVAWDVHQISGIELEKIHVLANPVITPEMHASARQPIEHPWFDNRQIPIIMGAGGLRRQKNFSSLIAAFAQVRAQMQARLVILGEGRQRQRLKALAAKLGVENDVDMPGFVDNAYAYMQSADLFVLSSLWEGSPNVLTEALALGTPVVATDCPSGPREVLQKGKFGPLVPIGDTTELARAMMKTLANPIDSKTLQSAVAAYTIEASARRYQQALKLASARQ